MSAWRILGPDGHPMVVAKPTGEIVRDTRALPADPLIIPGPGAVGKTDDLEKAWASDLQKRVRSRAVSMTAVGGPDGGRPKPTPVTYATLRLVAQRNEWIRAIVTTRKNQLAGMNWTIQVKDDDPSGAAARAAEQVTKLLTRPMMHGSKPRSTHWQQFLGMFVEDLLVLDRGCWEKERDGDGWIIAVYPVDGATVLPHLDDQGGYEPDAYVQVVDGMEQARFGMEELVCAMINEATDVRFAGYGMSPLESLITSVTADLHATRFNADYFEKGSIPEGILNLGEGVAAEDVDSFRHFWLSEITGRPWTLPIIGGSKAPEFIDWRQSNRDMQFMEYQQWLLQKMCAVFQLSKEELGEIEDVNRSTAEVQDSQQERKGIRPLADFVKHVIDLEIIGEHGQGLGDYLEFAWEQPGDTADQINAKYQPLHSAGVATGAEWRDAHGMDPDGDPDATHGQEGLRMHLRGGELLPSGDDAEVMGAAAQADREDQHRQEDIGATSGRPPVGKTAPAGHDRHPAMTDQQDALDGEFDAGLPDLFRGIAEALGG